MYHRTTFTLDEVTIDRLRKLATLWNISQAETVRRALEQAETRVMEHKGRKLESFTQWEASGGLAAQSAEAYLSEVKDHRSDWVRS